MFELRYVFDQLNSVLKAFGLRNLCYHKRDNVGAGLGSVSEYKLEAHVFDN